MIDTSICDTESCAIDQNGQHPILRDGFDFDRVGKRIGKYEVTVSSNSSIKELRNIGDAIVTMNGPISDLERQRQNCIVERGRYLTHASAIPLAFLTDIWSNFISSVFLVGGAQFIEGKRSTNFNEGVIDTFTSQNDIMLSVFSLPFALLIAIECGEASNDISG